MTCLSLLSFTHRNELRKIYPHDTMLNDIKSIVINIKEKVCDILFPQSLLINTFIHK